MWKKPTTAVSSASSSKPQASQARVDSTFFLGLLVSLTLLGLAGGVFFILGSDLQIDRSERQGVERLLPLNQLTEALQAHRSVMVSVLGGDEHLRAPAEQLRATVTQRVERTEQALPESLRKGPRWTAIRHEWQDIVSDGADWIVSETFNRHTALIGQLRELMLDVADYDNLSIDRALDTYYLQDALVRSTPLLLELHDQLRTQNIRALMRQSLGESQRSDLAVVANNIEAALNAQVASLARITPTSPELKPHLDEAQAAIAASIQHLLDITRRDILQEQFATPPAELIDHAADNAAKNYTLIYEVLIPALDQKLMARIDRAKRNLFICAAFALSALFAVFRLSTQVRLRNRQLNESVRLLEEENQRRQHTEDALRTAVAVANKASLAKTQFLANLSHEVRTPLNGVLGMASLLDMSNPSEEQVPLLAELTQSGKALHDMLERVLEFAHIEAGEIQLSLSPMHLPEVMDITMSKFRSAAMAKGLHLHSDIAADIPTLLMGDARRLQQVLAYLLDNAVKFTDSGEIVLSATIAPATDTAGQHCAVCIRVADTGIGIPEALRSEIFQSFVQADGSITRKAGGNGLGLACAQGLVKLMGGLISVSANANAPAGSVFSFTLVLEVCAVDD